MPVKNNVQNTGVVPTNIENILPANLSLAKPKTFPLKIVLVFSSGIIVTLAIVGGIFLFVNNKEKGNESNTITPTLSVTTNPTSSLSQTPITTTTVTTNVAKKTGSEIIFTDSTNAQYINYDYGFVINYTKAISGFGTCADENDFSPMPMKITEDIPNKVVYLSYSTQAMHIGDAGCVTKNVDLNLIKTGLPYVSKTYKTTIYPAIYAFHFKTVNNDTEIAAFGNEIYDQTYQDGKLCTIGLKQLTDSVNGEYKIKLNSNAGPNSYDDGTKCPLNFAYSFIYSNSKNLAITWAMGQAQIFNGDYKIDAAFVH